MLLPLGEPAPARERLAKVGLTVMPFAGEMQIAQVRFGSRAEKLGIEQGFKIASIEVPADRPDKEWMFLPALALLALVVVLQRLRLRARGTACNRAPVMRGAACLRIRTCHEPMTHPPSFPRLRRPMPGIRTTPNCSTWSSSKASSARR